MSEEKPMTEEEIKALEQDIEWDELYLDFLDLDYGSRIKEKDE